MSIRFIEVTTKDFPKKITINLDHVISFDPMEEGGTAFTITERESGGMNLIVETSESYAEVQKAICWHCVIIKLG